MTQDPQSHEGVSLQEGNFPVQIWKRGDNRKEGSCLLSKDVDVFLFPVGKREEITQMTGGFLGTKCCREKTKRLIASRI